MTINVKMPSWWLIVGVLFGCLALSNPNSWLPNLIPGGIIGTKIVPGDNFRVLIVEETAERDKLPKAQQDIFASTAIRAYEKNHCVKGENGDTGYRVTDKDDDVSNDSAWVKDAMALPRTGLPFIVISNGKSYTGSMLPPTEAETLALLKKYGGE